MFDERRNRAGIDKSYLLEPIAVESNRTTSNGHRQVIGPAKAAVRDQRITNYSKVIVPPLQNRITNNHDVNGNKYYKNAADDPIERTTRAAGDNALVKTKPGTKASTTGIGKKPSPPVSSVANTSPPLKNVTNQKVSG